MNNEEINLTGAVSEFRKLMRTFEALKHAEGVINALAESNAIVDNLKKEVKRLEQYKDTCNKELDELEKTLRNLSSDKDKLLQEVEEVKRIKRDESKKTNAEAVAEAARIKKEATNYAESLNTSIKTAKTELSQIQLEVASAESELKALRLTIDSEKSRLIKALG